MFFLLLVGVLSALLPALSAPLPVVLWHGMGDDCCNPKSMGAIKHWIENATSSFVYSLRIGASDGDDVANGFLMPARKQVEDACGQLLKLPQLSNGFNAVGFSQGGQFLRAVVQKCEGQGVYCASCLLFF